MKFLAIKKIDHDGLDLGKLGLFGFNKFSFKCGYGTEFLCTLSNQKKIKEKIIGIWLNDHNPHLKNKELHIGFVSNNHLNTTWKPIHSITETDWIIELNKIQVKLSTLYNDNVYVLLDSLHYFSLLPPSIILY